MGWILQGYLSSHRGLSANSAWTTCFGHPAGLGRVCRAAGNLCSALQRVPRGAGASPSLEFPQVQLGKALAALVSWWGWGWTEIPELLSTRALWDAMKSFPILTLHRPCKKRWKGRGELLVLGLSSPRRSVGALLMAPRSSLRANSCLGDDAALRKQL